MAIEVERLLAEALTKHGIRLDPNDPAVVLVTLNRLVLEDAVKSVAADVRQATRDFEDAASRVQGLVGTAIAARLKVSASSAPFPATWSRWVCVYVALGAGVGLFLIGVAVGRWILR